MTSYEKELACLCYNHFKSTGLKEFTYYALNGNDLCFASDATSSMEEDGYISNVVDNGFSFSFTIEDSLIRYMQQLES